MDSPNSAAEPEIRPATNLATAMARLAIKATMIVRRLWPSAVLCSDPCVALPPAGRLGRDPEPHTPVCYARPAKPDFQSQGRFRRRVVVNEQGPSLAIRGSLTSVSRGAMAFTQDVADKWHQANRLLLEQYKQWAAQKVEAGA